MKSTQFKYHNYNFNTLRVITWYKGTGLMIHSLSPDISEPQRRCYQNKQQTANISCVIILRQRPCRKTCLRTDTLMGVNTGVIWLPINNYLVSFEIPYCVLPSCSWCSKGHLEHHEVVDLPQVLPTICLSQENVSEYLKTATDACILANECMSVCCKPTELLNKQITTFWEQKR